MAVPNIEKPSGLNVNIDVDSTQLDVALAKAKELVANLEKADGLIIKIKQFKFDGAALLDGNEKLNGIKAEFESTTGRGLLVTYQAGSEVKNLITAELNRDVSIDEYLDGIMDYEKNYYGFKKQDGHNIFVKASNVLAIEEL